MVKYKYNQKQIYGLNCFCIIEFHIIVYNDRFGSDCIGAVSYIVYVFCIVCIRFGCTILVITESGISTTILISCYMIHDNVNVTHTHE